MPNNKGSKPSLVLVHSLCSNSKTLRGLVEFLSECYEVHAVDLPGFSKQGEPLISISLASLGAHLAKAVERLNLRSYVLAGISFGFLVVNALPPPAECKGILAVAPFIGIYALRRHAALRFILRLAIRAVLRFRIEGQLWNSRLFGALMSLSSHRERYKQLWSEVDPRTFLSAAHIAVTWNRPPVFHSLPYVLMINVGDLTIDARRVTSTFVTGAGRLLVMPNEIEHSPTTLSREYFASKVPLEQFRRINCFLEEGPNGPGETHWTAS